MTRHPRPDPAASQVQQGRIPGWVPLLAGVLLGSGTVAGWLIWQDLGLTLWSAGMLLALVVGLGHWAWGP